LKIKTAKDVLLFTMSLMVGFVLSARAAQETVQAPTKAELAQRAAVERTRTLERRRELQAKQRAAAFAALPLEQKKKNPRWMATVERITDDAGNQQASKYVPLTSGGVETARKLTEHSLIAAHRNNANSLSRYDVWFKDGSHEIYNRYGILAKRIPAPVRPVEKIPDRPE
jgi:hypothetical protein